MSKIGQLIVEEIDNAKTEEILREANLQAMQWIEQAFEVSAPQQEAANEDIK